jgi:hypothetical protein
MISIIKKLCIVPYTTIIMNPLINESDGFLIPDNPLKKIVWGRAVMSSISEKIQLDMTDSTAIFHQITCNCDHRFLGLYFLSVSYIVWRNTINYNDGSDNKLQHIEYYLRYKRIIKHVLFLLFLVFTKDVEQVI